MTKNSVSKLAKCVSIFVICLGIFLLIDTFSSKDVPSEAALTTQQANSNNKLQTIIESINNENTSETEFASNYYDIAIETGVPKAFSSEVLSAESFESVAKTNSTFSLVYNGTQDKAAQFCKTCLEEKNWHALEANTSNNNASILESYAKAQGEYRWATVQYIANGEKTIVLVRVFS